MLTFEVRWLRNFVNVTKTLILWSMLISGIVLATRQARAECPPHKPQTLAAISISG
jgi:hypothetical protein